MTTVPKDTLGAPEQPPRLDRTNPFTGKGIVDSRPPQTGMGAMPVPTITGKGTDPAQGPKLIDSK